MDLYKMDQGTEAYMEAIYPREVGRDLWKKIWKKRLSNLFLLLGLALILALVCRFMPQEKRVENGMVKRGEEDQELELLVTRDQRQEAMTFQLEKRHLSQEEIKALGDQIRSRGEALLLGDNPSVSEIRTGLNFFTAIEDCPASLSWDYEEEFFGQDGSLIKESIPKEGVETDLILHASYLDWEEDFGYSLFLPPPDFSTEEEEKILVQREIQEAIDQQESKEEVVLPDLVADRETSYGDRQEEAGYGPVYVIIFLILMLPLIWGQEVRKKMEEREEELLLDHPGLVNKLMLLLGAGLTVRGAVDRLVQEYETGLKEGQNKRYAYEELCICAQEMRDGKGEAMAMEAFGKRCKLLPYLRFSSVIAQNIKKGSEGILEILETESMEALIQRKSRALAQGEKAGTKLLFPMIMMLGLVMAMIMVPAFMTM
ncbi:MAG: hypothetical protein K6G62_04665 [Eubacterium sp.]|nr:hypothetical protein [Eubacterium sp.]